MTHDRATLNLSVTLAVLFFSLVGAVYAAQPILESDVRPFMRAWLAAQNDGHFDAYESFYAERFAGIRRSGTRTVPMNRIRWMTDRKKMFATSMHVEIRHVHVTPGPQAVITFTQSWTNPTYHDKGLKQLVLVRDLTGQVKISQEEMLASHVLRHEVGPQRHNLTFAFLLRGYIVLPITPEKVWESGPPVLIPRVDSLAVARVGVDGTTLPLSIKQWQGQAIRVFRSDGQSCEAEISDLNIIAAEIPHFGEVQQWNGVSEDGAKPLPESEIAARIMTRGQHYLVGGLKSAVADCSEAVWAQSDQVAMPNVAAPKSGHDEVRELITQELHRNSDYQAAGAEGGFAKGDPWDESTGLQILLFTFLSGDTYFSVVATAGNSCSSEKAATFTALGRLTGGDASPHVQWLGHFNTSYSINAAIRNPGETAPWFLYETFPDVKGLLKSEHGHYERAEDLVIPYFDCPC